MPKVDLAHYENRKQAYIKHCLLEEYLPELAYKIGSSWNSLVYVDGFAGPWMTKHYDYADSSFGVAVDALKRCQEGLRSHRGRDLDVDVILVEENKATSQQLVRFAATRTKENFRVHALNGEFIEQIPAIEAIISRSSSEPFKFVFLDPKGWSDIPMDRLRRLLNNRSCEVLVNLMTRHIIRFLDETSRANSFKALFGRPGVLERLRMTPKKYRTEQAVQEYSLSLKLLCNFSFVSSAVILEPDKESSRYFLIYASNHPRGIEVFKTAEKKASRIQDQLRHERLVEKTRQPAFSFDQAPQASPKAFQLRKRYVDISTQNTLKLLTDASTPLVRYSDVYCEFMQLPLVTSEELHQLLESLKPDIEFVFDQPGKRYKLNLAKDDRVRVVNRKSLVKRWEGLENQ